MSNLDRHRLIDLHPVGKMAEPVQTPIDVLVTAAALLERHAPTSSEARACADRLRLMVRQLAAAQGGR